MQKKLTLRLEESKIQKVKEFAKKHETSVSQMVSNYIDFLDRDDTKNDEGYATPITDSLTGIFSGEVNEDDYKEYLEKKHTE